ncbi:MAG: hypothetical protein K2G37_05750, partial [Clostridia bacterium]|nr:hypothetical protein [Clostridia bacterium]MDE7329374.1 hypothetical protein [Clostridia bacterium]
MKVLKCLQISFIYIGAIIGAGFATGREVMLYFGGGGVLGGIIAGLAMGILCGLFLLSAKSYRRLKNSDKLPVKIIFGIIKSLLWLCTLVSFVCMVSGCEEIIGSCFGIKNAGLWTGIFVSVLGACEMSVMRKFNAVIVPLIMALLVALSSQGTTFFESGFQPIKVLCYCGMNIMTGGYIIAEQEDDFSLKQVLFISCVTAVFFALAISLVYFISIDYKNFSMPIMEFAKARNMKSVSGLIIYLAIFSTLIGCAKLICQENSRIKIPAPFSVAFLVAFALVALKCDFSTLVARFYPIIGYIGVGYTAFTLVLPTAVYIYDVKSGKRKYKRRPLARARGRKYIQAD